MEKYNNKSKLYPGINSFWVIQNNKPVIDALNKLSNRKAAKSISNEFSTLYTHILHGKLIKTSNSVIDFAFKVKTQNKISINNYNIANWCKYCRCFVFDIKILKKAVYNCYLASRD